MAASLRRPALLALAAALVLLAGALLRGWLIPAHRSDLAPEAQAWRLSLPWAPRAGVSLTFPTPDGSLWVSVRRTVSLATPLAALQELAAGPAPGTGLAAVLPAGALVTGVQVADGVATVEIAGWEPAPADPAVPVALTAMSRTLAGQFPILSLRAVTAVGRTLGPVAVTDPGTRVTYLWHGLPVPVAAELPAGEDRAVAAVRRLLAGPAPIGTVGAPTGVQLLGVQVKGDLARVSLDLAPAVMQELLAGRWLFAPHAMAVVYTLTDLPGIRRVQFDFPNLPSEARRQCRTPLGVPLVRPAAEPGLVKG